MKSTITALALAFLPFTLGASIYEPVRPDVPRKGKILIISDNNFNDTELLYPLYRFTEEGYEVTIASINGGEIKGYNSAAVPNTVKISEIGETVDEYLALYLPGGQAPAKLRDDGDVRATVKAFAEAGKPIGAICHGPQILVSSDLVEGKTMTSVAGVKSEITEANGEYRDEAVVRDGQFVTSRLPGDLPVQIPVFLKLIKENETP